MASNCVVVGTIDQFPVGRFTILTVNTLEIGVLQLSNGEFHAVRNRCPHKGAAICKGIVGGTWPPSAVGELSYEREGEVLVCPWHGYEYDIKTGRELYQEHATRLRKYDVAVDEGSVVLTLRSSAPDPSL